MLKTFSIITVFLICSCIHSFAQTKGDYQWIFGSNALPLEGSEGSLITFTNEGLDTSYVQLSESIGSNNASICDDNGRLLFYTNGCAVFDSTFQIMENGDGINVGGNVGQCHIGNYPGLQNSIILEDPGNPLEYYYLHKEVNLDDEFKVNLSSIQYSKISFDNSQTGKVLEKNVKVSPDKFTVSGLTEAIRHQNTIDWWIIDFTESPEENFYLAYLINQDTITLQHEFEIENIASLDEWCSSTSQSCFSPDGTKLAKMCPLTGFDLWDFDRSNGTISNYRHLPLEAEYHTCGIGISPNSRFAYLSCADSLWQVDLWEEDLSAGLELIDTLDTTAELGTATNFGYQQLGPDCKIYMNTIRQYDWLHVINKPDEKGKACDFRQHSIKLPHLNQPGSFPNFPHFRIDEDQVCDPTITSVFGVPVEATHDIKIYPNPTSGKVYLEIPETVFGRLLVRDVSGQVMLRRKVDNSRDLQLDLSDLGSGVYLLEVYSGDGRRWVERVVVID